MELLYVEWEDAGSVDVGTWIDREGAPEPTPHMFRQVGFVNDADLESITLTEAYSDDQMAPRTRIPMGMIRRVVYLDPGESQPEQLL